MSASEELERLAAKYANEAIQMDRQGSNEMAVKRYQRAIELLLKLGTLYPEAPQKRIYLERVNSYKNRIEEIRGGSSTLHRLDTEKQSSVKTDQLIITEKPQVYWNDIADLEEAKKAIEEALIFPVKRPDLFPLGWPRGILFYGPPGCGKTLLASAIATEIDAVFYCVDAASLMSKYLGESEKNVASLFKEARTNAVNGQPSVIFLDEIDSILGRRLSEVGGEVRTRNQFLKEMDGIIDKTRPLHVYLIGATNKPWELDDAFIRRFQRRIYVPLPNQDARKEIFKIHTKNIEIEPTIKLDDLASITDGYSSSDIRDIIQTVHIKVVRELFEKGKHTNNINGPREISYNDFKKIMEKRKPSVSKHTLKSYQTWSNEFSTH